MIHDKGVSLLLIPHVQTLLLTLSQADLVGFDIPGGIQQLGFDVSSLSTQQLKDIWEYNSNTPPAIINEHLVSARHCSENFDLMNLCHSNNSCIRETPPQSSYVEKGPAPRKVGEPSIRLHSYKGTEAGLELWS